MYLFPDCYETGHLKHIRVHTMFTLKMYFYSIYTILLKRFKNNEECEKVCRLLAPIIPIINILYFSITSIFVFIWTNNNTVPTMLKK